MRAILLSSPFHRLLSKGWLLLEFHGTRSAHPYADDDSELVVLAREDADWWEELPRDQPTAVEVRLRGQRRHGTARFATGEDLDRAMITFLHAHPGAWRDLGVAPDSSPEEVGTAARRSAALLIKLHE